MSLPARNVFLHPVVGRYRGFKRAGRREGKGGEKDHPVWRALFGRYRLPNKTNWCCNEEVLSRKKKKGEAASLNDGRGIPSVN